MNAWKKNKKSIQDLHRLCTKILQMIIGIVSQTEATEVE